tara:strand:- start:15643 stop:15981 length:339 start_codon:yes stop_codon:yes gene_type:complete
MTQTIEVLPIRGSKLASQIEVDLPTLGVDEEVPADCGIIRIMNSTGDDRIAWNKFSLTEINKAKEAFDKLVEEGLVPYKVGTNGKATSEVMSEFDPAAEEVIFMPVGLVAGG